MVTMKILKMHVIFQQLMPGCRNMSTVVSYIPRRLSRKEVVAQRNTLFDAEIARQKSLVVRLEKIQVQYEGSPENALLFMNKGVSSPYNCAQHLGDMLSERSVLAEVNGELWDMHRPLKSDCTLKMLHFKAKDVQQIAHVNRTFWRSCSFILGAVAESVFKEDTVVQLHSFPSPNVRSGSFVYDIGLSLNSWQPTKAELRQISAAFSKFCATPFAFERLQVDATLALKMFTDNPFKTEQIPQIASQSDDGNSITLYRLGSHIDISKGPMMASTHFVGRSSISAVHPLESSKNALYRFQGIALPHELYINHFSYGLIEERSKELVS
nr:EOG090X0A3R [Lepidurus arcticus]